MLKVILDYLNISINISINISQIYKFICYYELKRYYNLTKIYTDTVISYYSERSISRFD